MDAREAEATGFFTTYSTDHGGLRAATRVDWATVDRLIAIRNEGHRDFIREIIRPGHPRLAGEN